MQAQPLTRRRDMKATSNAAAVRAATRSRSSAPDLGARPPLLHQPAVQTLRSSSIPTNVAAPSSSGRLVGGHCVPRGAMLQPRARMDAEGNGGALPPRRVERTLKTQPSRNVAGKLDIGSQNKRELLVLVDMLPESIREVLVEHEEFSHVSRRFLNDTQISALVRDTHHIHFSFLPSLLPAHLQGNHLCSLLNSNQTVRAPAACPLCRHHHHPKLSCPPPPPPQRVQLAHLPSSNSTIPSAMVSSCTTLMSRYVLSSISPWPPLFHH